MKPTVARILRQASHVILAAEVVDDANEGRVEAEALLCHALGMDRAQLYANLGGLVQDGDSEAFAGMVDRRRLGEPVAYILGYREFYGLRFAVDRRVLIPRPETELLVELVLDAARGLVSPIICDVGCGSGCVAAAIARHLPVATIFAVDVSRDALEVASLNFRQLGVDRRINALEGDLLTSVPEMPDIVVANLPYVRSSDLDALPASIRRFEPLAALDGGADGLALIRRLLEQIPGRVRAGGVVFLEVGYDEAARVIELAGRLIPLARMRSHPDLAGVDRVVEIRVANR